MQDVSPLYEKNDDVTFLKLARQIAMDLYPIEEILKQNAISNQQWEQIQANRRFVSYLESATAEWHAPKNAQERVRMKAVTVIEEWLPELAGRLYAPSESLNAKIEAGKLVAKLAGLGEKAQVAETGEKVAITINLGDDRKITLEKDITPRVIDHEEE